MSVKSVTEITGRDGSLDVDTVIRYRRQFQVITTTAQDGASVVLQVPGSPLWTDPYVPTFNEAYSYLDTSDPAFPVTVTDPQAVVVNISVSQDDGDDLTNWTITVEYAGVDDPTAQPAEVDYSPTRYQLALVDDVNGEHVVNSAGDPFPEGITVDRTRYTLVIVKNKVDWDPIAAAAYQDTLNEGSFLAGVHPTSPDGFDPGTCKLTMGSKRVRRAGTTTFYWQVRYEVDIDLRGWKVKVRDAGYRYIPTGETDPIPIQKGGVPASSPQLLDGTGNLLPAGGTPVLAGPGGPASVGFDGYETADWSPLGITY